MDCVWNLEADGCNPQMLVLSRGPQAPLSLGALFIIWNRQDLPGCVSMKPGCGRVVHLADRCSVSMRSFPSSLNVAPEYRLSYVDAEKPSYHHLKTLFFPPISLTVRTGTWPHSSRLLLLLLLSRFSRVQLCVTP